MTTSTLSEGAPMIAYAIIGLLTFGAGYVAGTKVKP